MHADEPKRLRVATLNSSIEFSHVAELYQSLANFLVNSGSKLCVSLSVFPVAAIAAVHEQPQECPCHIVADVDEDILDDDLTDSKSSADRMHSMQIHYKFNISPTRTSIATPADTKNLII